MPDNDMPKLTETELDDLWRFRAEHKDAEEFHQQRRRAADQEVLRRAAAVDAQILGTPWGEIEILYSSEYAYDRKVVDGEFYALIERDGLQAEWNQFVQHSYKINKTWLNRLVKREGYREVIERMTQAGKGSPSIKGPSLERMGGYATEPEEVQI